MSDESDMTEGEFDAEFAASEPVWLITGNNYPPIVTSNPTSVKFTQPAKPKPPRGWWCTSWRMSPFCALDILTRCKVPAICQLHDWALNWDADRWAKREDS